MRKGVGGESGVSFFFEALLLLEELLLSTLPRLFDKINAVSDGFSHHLSITLMEESRLHLTERERERESF